MLIDEESSFEGLYLFVESEEIQTIILYNNYKEIIDYKRILEASFEEFRVILWNNHRILASHNNSFGSKFENISCINLKDNDCNI